MNKIIFIILTLIASNAFAAIDPALKALADETLARRGNHWQFVDDNNNQKRTGMNGDFIVDEAPTAPKQSLTLPAPAPVAEPKAVLAPADLPALPAPALVAKPRPKAIQVLADPVVPQVSTPAPTPVVEAPVVPAKPAPAPLSYATSSDLHQDAPVRPTITPAVIKRASFNWEAADENNAEALTGDDGSVMYPYGASRPIVACAPLHVCIIKLQDDEHITNLTIGDSVRWKAQASTAGKFPVVVVKPTVTDITTNLSIMTDAGRIYYLTLVSYKNRWVPLIAFYDPARIVETVSQQYVDQAKAADAAKKRKEDATVATLPGDDIASMDFEYAITGPSSDIKPVRVFSSAGHTYIQMPESLRYKDAPAIFSLVNGEQQLVNFKSKGNYYIVDGIPDKINLVLGAGSNAKTVTIQHKTNSSWFGG